MARFLQLCFISEMLLGKQAVGRKMVTALMRLRHNLGGAYL